MHTSPDARPHGGPPDRVWLVPQDDDQRMYWNVRPEVTRLGRTAIPPTIAATEYIRADLAALPASSPQGEPPEPEPCPHCVDGVMGQGDDACHWCYSIALHQVAELQKQLDAFGARPVPSPDALREAWYALIPRIGCRACTNEYCSECDAAYQRMDKAVAALGASPEEAAPAERE